MSKVNPTSIKIENALKAMENRNDPAKAPQDPTVYTTDEGNTYKTTDRIVSDVVPPTSYRPTDSEVFKPNGLPDYHYLQEHFLKEGRLSEQQVLKILRMATKILSDEPNILHLDAPITVCGDIHGQFYDLVKLFEIGGDPATHSYLFLGDYVDRGLFSIECLLLLYAIKINHPNTLWMLRGNHESKRLTDYFTFKSECLRKFSMAVYTDSLDSFRALPLCAIMNKQFFCVHGGISPELDTLQDIEKLNRFVREIPSHGLMSDLLWADPRDDYDENTRAPAYVRNEQRGCSYSWSYRASCEFLDRNGLLCIIRAHQAQDAGYKMYKRTETMKFPSILTLFSAPNYCGTYHNKAAILKYENAVMNIRQFNSSPQPYYLPQLIDVFSWSLPFVGSKVTEMLLAMLNVCTEQELQDESFGGAVETEPKHEFSPENLEARKALRNKILAIGRMSRMFTVLRQEAESVEHLRTLAGGSSLPRGVLLSGSDGINKKIMSFEEARIADMKNEAMPPSLEERRQEDKEHEIRLQRQLSFEEDNEE
ncbi:unnamed protein product [Kuraishia capsulata CBS 1993]|uniref:Serine/threonine-protein phosphatase n=1 Tax=Kuraishia capsulata CBS 1993 TaxID=1382522 RepID=W6MFR8_9ASCO|nr:uncharacterized protein KUCA_T00000188001 [Kuraishia capsulata CBS 1993]CDK24228.1 unnamed protein product [Kuraishia capsulata CBS 1993]